MVKTSEFGTVAPRRRVIKLGGSLLNCPDLASRFTAWHAVQQEAINLLVVGGGDLVEAIRVLDRQHGLDKQLAHWLCVELMDATAKVAAEILHVGEVLNSPTELQAWLDDHRDRRWSCPPLAIVQPSAYYTQRLAQVSGCTLPEDWRTTSDSIASWLATCCQADELVLLKSCAAPVQGSFDTVTAEALAEAAFVDASFPQAAQAIPRVRFIDLLKSTNAT
jgi:5-(aminomethyl)-3-furanmethanol phosphate kinase